MSLPPIEPNKTASGIAVDPRTLDRVIPQSKRSDGSVRQERKVRPGFTPQEDVTIFRGSKQQQMDRNALPKGHILGWVAPTAATSAPKKTAAGKDGAVLSKSAKKNEKRREKKREEKEKIIRENWEESDEEVRPTKPSNKGSGPANTELGSNIGAQQEMDNLAEQLASTGLNQP